eukprot:TRINITY_DN408_c0_g1_i1.p1 TRINITY_DN408_c0_g1~~TRINITY_DN408_c0_g1_i1.p1  ORF type:complete len:258 (+),score=74.60 TRINITY_DN408_c0_g1_i1:42-815(+)
MPLLVLIRHGESTWNKENKFTGWVDCGLSEKGVQEASQGAQALAAAGIKFDVAFTSVLKRAIKTLWIVLETLDLQWIPYTPTWRLNERMYGSLQGLNKAEVTAQHGEKQVLVWRRSFDIPPPLIDESSQYFPGNDPKYASIDRALIPRAESLKDTIARCLPFWNENIATALKSGQRVLVAAHGNSLRGIVKHLDGISDEDITNLEIPTGIPLVYELDDDLRPIKSDKSMLPLSGWFLGDPEVIRKAQEAVRAQISKK